MSDTTVYLREYQEPAFEVQTINLSIDLFDDYALINNAMQLKRHYPGALVLNGDELELEQIKLNGVMLETGQYQWSEGDLILPDCSDEALVEVQTRIYPQKNSQLMGLYRSNHLFCTQCEAEGFRRITFYPDRPDVLAKFTTRISAEKAKYPVLLSNGNLVSQGDEAEGRHWALWEDPFKKPSYLFAMVAGDLVCIEDNFTTCTGRKIDLRIYVEPGNEDKCAHAMASLKHAMRWDEDEYGREYDLDIFMIVAVSDFNMGAMENKGLNIFNSKYILARPDTATDQDFADIEGVVAHEYFHNWTGNRVTCRDWFQLSLKEGLTVFRDQEFSRDMNSRDVNRIQDVKALRTAQFPEDAGKMAHPVRPESYEEINNFYTATVYNKGAEVIRMQRELLGQEGFRKGMDLYFRRHDGQAVTIDDFVAAMSDANQMDLTQFKNWYSQAGTPKIDVASSYEAKTLTLRLTQSCPPTPENHDKKPFHIPVSLALFKQNGEEIKNAPALIELKDSTQEFRCSDLAEKPIVSLLRGFSAPVKLNYEMPLTEHLAILRVESDGFAKWDAAQKVSLHIMTSWQTKQAPRWTLPKELLAALAHVIEDAALDNALKAELLTPPGFEDLAGELGQNIDVDQVEAIRDAYRHQLGEGLFQLVHDKYNTLWQDEDHAMHARAYGRRALRNVCLWLMMKAREHDALSLCQNQFAKAKTMTDQLACFALLSNSSDPKVREQAIEQFYQQWSEEELVMDKWFAILAMSEMPDTLKHVRKLLKHPKFSIKNPNKVRSLVGTFCMSNPRNFHALDGSGYAFLTEMLLELDTLNPQVAARIATPFTRWQRFDSVRQGLMKNELKRLSQHTLSRDLHELVGKSLKDAV